MAFIINKFHQSSSSTIAFGHQIKTPMSQNHTFSQALGIHHHQWSIIATSHKLKQFVKPLKTNHYSLFNHTNSLSLEQEDTHAKHAQLVNTVRRLMAEVNDERFEDLMMVDALQRLAIDHHFKDEINSILTRRHMQFINKEYFQNKNLFEVSLCFRILRQNGFHISADCFKKFKGSDNEFDKNLKNDIRGLMALYEASQLSIEGETILDEAENFSYHTLHETMKFRDEDEARMISHTLESPYQKTLPFFSLKNSINDYNGTCLQELAQLDFNIVQSIHQKELNQILRWWKDLGLGRELILARDQPLKWYLWPMAALTNPYHSSQRIDLTKTISLIYIIDDIFDVYGTIDELTLFTEAINRWDINAIEQLPSYMKSSFKAIYNITHEIANKVYEKHGFNPINSLLKSWSTLFDAFLVEAKWFASGHIPKANEYLKIAMRTSGVELLLVHMFFVLGNSANEVHDDLIDDDHGIVSSVSKILRLWDDLGTASDENQEGHDGSYITCFLNEHEGCSTKSARQHALNLISDTWKRLNKECLSPNPFSDTFTKASYNIARMVPLMYSYGDNSSLPLLDDYVKAVLLDDISGWI